MQDAKTATSYMPKPTLCILCFRHIPFPNHSRSTVCTTGKLPWKSSKNYQQFKKYKSERKITQKFRRYKVCTARVNLESGIDCFNLKQKKKNVLPVSWWNLEKGALSHLQIISEVFLNFLKMHEWKQQCIFYNKTFFQEIACVNPAIILPNRD